MMHFHLNRMNESTGNSVLLLF